MLHVCAHMRGVDLAGVEERFWSTAETQELQCAQQSAPWAPTISSWMRLEEDPTCKAVLFEGL